MCIPLFFVCGNTESIREVGAPRYCANCGTKDGARLYEASGRFQFCFIPLCRTGQPRQFYRCITCGAVYPAQVAAPPAGLA